MNAKILLPCCLFGQGAAVSCWSEKCQKALKFGRSLVEVWWDVGRGKLGLWKL